MLAAFPRKRSKKAVTTVRSRPASNSELWFGDYPIPHRRGSFWPGAETRLRNPPADGRLQTLVGPGTAETVRGQSGAGEKPAGKRLASDKRHRADTNLKTKGLLPHDGGKERGPDIVWTVGGLRTERLCCPLHFEGCLCPATFVKFPFGRDICVTRFFQHHLNFCTSLVWLRKSAISLCVSDLLTVWLLSPLTRSEAKKIYLTCRHYVSCFD